MVAQLMVLRLRSDNMKMVEVLELLKNDIMDDEVHL